MRDIPFGNLKRHYASIRDEIDRAVQRVLESGWYILGDELAQFEKEFAEFIVARHCTGVGSGTEALHLALVAAGIETGDHVITVANTAVPTLSAISFAGAVPIFVEIDPDSYCIDTSKIEAAITAKTKAIVPVHLYGHACDMPTIMDIARARGIKVIEDCAQAHGAKIKGRMVGTFGDYGCFSFYPSKNLGAFGDAGLVVTSDAAEAEKLKKLRNYGQSKRYYHDSIGFNSRLDELQAAILATKLPHLHRWIDRRQEIAALYRLQIKNRDVHLPFVKEGVEHVYHLFVIRHPQRNELQRYLQEHGVGSQIHYPVPCHLQVAYSFLGMKNGSLPITENYAQTVLSLPNYPELTDDEIIYMSDILNEF